MFAVYKKELKTYIFTPIGYIFVGLFLLILSFVFYLNIYQSQYINFEYLFYNGSTVLTFIMPILTMRLFSEERKNGTEQLLLTSPRSLTSIVLGKFFAAATIVFIAEALTMMYFLILNYFGNPSLPIATATLLGFFLLSLAYLSLGMFISSITENQVIAAVVTMAAFFFMLFGPQITNVLKPIFLLYYFQESFITGLIMVKSIIVFVAFILLFLLLTILVLQKRKSIK